MYANTEITEGVTAGGFLHTQVVLFSFSVKIHVSAHDYCTPTQKSLLLLSSQVTTFTTNHHLTRNRQHLLTTIYVKFNTTINQICTSLENLKQLYCRECRNEATLHQVSQHNLTSYSTPTKFPTAPTTHTPGLKHL